MVSGTKMMSDTSLVTNMEEKNTPKTRNSDKPAMVLILRVRRMTGRKMFSRLKPSSTVSIMKSVASVFQSISVSRRALGGVIISAATAAVRETSSMTSFLAISRARFMTIRSPFQADAFLWSKARVRHMRSLAADVSGITARAKARPSSGSVTLLEKCVSSSCLAPASRASAAASR